MESWYVRQCNGAENFWHSYIAYRARNETDAQVGRLVEIRQAAEAYCSKSGSSDLDGTVESLCWMALERAARWPTFKAAYLLDCERSKAKEAPDPGLNLLGEAAHLGNMPLAKQFLEEGHCPAPGWQEDVVDLLLERGMDPENNSGDPAPLDAATSAGSMSIVRKLISHGASPDTWGLNLFTNAVRLEHTALLECLLERNVCHDAPLDRKRVLQEATEWGLESMVDIMQRFSQKHPV